ncbi:MAG: DRTGG domain-containing protein [Balneolales bacterium]
MKSAVFASMQKGSGKTSVLIGIMAALNNRYGYIKPLGDRLIYKRKRNRDYDSNLIVDLFGLAEEPEGITLGFDHSKLRYMYDNDTISQAVGELVVKAGKDREGVFIEAGKDIFYGASLRLDPLSLARYTDSSLVMIVSGEDESIIDALTFTKRNIDIKDIKNTFVIINKVNDVDEFESLYLKDIKNMGFNVLGILPYKEQLSTYSVSYLAERLYAKVIAGEKGMGQTIKNIFVGAMSTGESLRNPLFNKENKFLITSGDRSDMILAALESNAVGVLLTNNILPPSNIISLANEKHIPLLLVAMDTFNAARKIGRLETLLTSENKELVQLLSQMADKYIDIDRLFG